MAVLEPLKVVIKNSDGERLVDALDFPNHSDSPAHKVPFTSVVYIDRSDFRMEV